MAYLNEHSGLNVEQLNKLPFEEYMDAMSNLTPDQVKEYLTKLQIKESHEPIQAVKVNYGRNDKRSGVDASELIQNLRAKCKKQQ